MVSLLSGESGPATVVVPPVAAERPVVVLLAGIPVLAVTALAASWLLEPWGGSGNQSLRGLALQLGLHGGWLLVAWAVTALVGFWAFPLAPPRLTPGHGFRDTLHAGADADPLGALTKLANQFAAMPSLHVGWSSWCAVVIVCLTPYLWLRMLGAVYPLCTLLAILATANHWILDALGGVGCLAAAWGLQYLLTGHRLTVALKARTQQPAGDR